MLERYPAEVKLVNKNYPLANHKFARKAAEAALAADAQGKFWEFHKKLFDSRNAINDAKIQEIATQLGLDMAEFNRNRMSKAVQKLITRDISDGKAIGIRGVPAVFINGKFLKNRSLQDFQQMIDREIQKEK